MYFNGETIDQCISKMCACLSNPMVPLITLKQLLKTPLTLADVDKTLSTISATQNAHEKCIETDFYK